MMRDDSIPGVSEESLTVNIMDLAISLKCVTFWKVAHFWKTDIPSFHPLSDHSSSWIFHIVEPENPDI